MTGQLRTTLHARAHDVEVWAADLDAIVRDGDRRVRRRRVVIAGGVAGVVAVVGGVSAFTARGHTTQPQPADHDAKPLTYAVGQVIHDGGQTVDVGVRVESMVQTARGFVFSGPDQKVYEEESGDVQQIGHLANAQSRIVTGDDGLVATWWDGESIRVYPFTYGSGVNDTISVADSWPSDAPPHVEALSDGHMWFWTGQDTRVSDVAPSHSTGMWKDDGFPQVDMVQDAAGDQILVRVGGGLAVTKADLAPQSPNWDGGTDLTGVEPQVPNLYTGDLAPDGKHWFSHDNDEFAVFDSATGERQEPAHPGFAFAAPYQWLGNDTMAVLATKGSSDDPQISLLTCRVSTNDCQVTAPDIGGYADIAIPVGVPIGD